MAIGFTLFRKSGIGENETHAGLETRIPEGKQGVVSTENHVE